MFNVTTFTALLLTRLYHCCSGVARLGHTGARALATRGCAPPVQVFIRIIGSENTVVDRESGGKRSSNRTAQYRYVYPQNYKSRNSPYANLLYKYTALRYGLRTVLGGCNILGNHSPDLPNTSALGVVCPCCALASAMSWLRHCTAVPLP